MRIDNSLFKLFQFCPLAVWEKLVNGIELDSDRESLDFGGRFHNLLHGHYGECRDVPLTDERLEAEAQATFAGYLAHYPVEDFEIIECERTYEIPIPLHSDGVPLGGQPIHTYAFKIDMTVRERGIFKVFETKTQKRGSTRNDPESWAARSQVALYQWGAEHIYQEPVGGIILNLIQRASPKGQEPATFWRDEQPRRSVGLVQLALRDLHYTADQIEYMLKTGNFPSFREHCKDGWRKCEFYPLHVIGRTDANLKLYRPAEKYLDL